MLGEIEVESRNASLLHRTMVEERKRNDLTISSLSNALRIEFEAKEINEVRAMVNAIINDLSCAEKLIEVKKDG